MSPINGFAAEATGATILLVAGKYGMPVSTTHAITTSIMGVGMAKHGRALNLIVAERIVWAWIFTIPGTGILAFLFFTALRPFIG
jgi:PiT family inorganic phosphate transporter